MVQFLVGLALLAPTQTLVPTSGLVITKSCKLAKGDYLLAGSEALLPLGRFLRPS